MAGLNLVAYTVGQQTMISTQLNIKKKNTKCSSQIRSVYRPLRALAEILCEFNCAI